MRTTAPCSWAKPGANPYTGGLAAALDRYGFTPSEKAHIVSLHKRLDFDSFVTIRKDGIEAPFGGTAGNLRDMHFGGSYCAGDVDRSGWAPDHSELALVYCAGAKCVAIPRVCGNVSRIDWQPKQRAEVEIRPEHDEFVPREINTVPEPGSIALVAVALVVMALIRRSRCRS